MIVFVSQFIILLMCNYLIYLDKNPKSLIGYTLLEVYIFFLVGDC
ncbi:hypothetical protein MICAER10613_031540 [Microcystis aeruginosa]